MIYARKKGKEAGAGLPPAAAPTHPPARPAPRRHRRAHHQLGNAVERFARQLVHSPAGSTGTRPYAAMSLDEIRALPVESLAADDAVLWLWTPNTFLPDAFSVVSAWGFDYKVPLTWVKPHFGVGEWLRGQTEHCLFAVRGHPAVLGESEGTALGAETTGHSRKPEAFFEKVERMCPGSKLELFARARRPGWTAWGLEVAVVA